MKLAYQLKDVTFDENSVITVGSFDGIHCGHQEIIRDVVRRARDRNGRSVVVTFEPHPREVVGTNKDEFRILSTVEERETMCRSLGVELFFLVTFDYEFSRQSSRDFFRKYLVEGIGVSEVVEGYDHHFGRDREGSAEALLKLGKEFDFSFVALKHVSLEGEVVSSTLIRSLVTQGDVEKVARLLGRPYAVKGTVVDGEKRGRLLGYPTANIEPDSNRKLIPKNGIYFVGTNIGGRKEFGMASIGVRPTFYDDGRRIVEANILNFDGTLYGQLLEISFLKRLRDELKFASAQELIEQMDKDRQQSLQLIQQYQQPTKR